LRPVLSIADYGPANNLPYKHGITDCVVNIADIIAVEPMAALTQKSTCHGRNGEYFTTLLAACIFVVFLVK